MPMQNSAASSASEAKNRLTEGFGSDSLAGSTRRKQPAFNVILRFGGVI